MNVRISSPTRSGDALSPEGSRFVTVYRLSPSRRGVRPDESVMSAEELAGQVGATAVVVRARDKELLNIGEPSAAVDCRSLRQTAARLVLCTGAGR